MSEPTNRRPRLPVNALPETHLAVVIEDLLRIVAPEAAVADADIDLRAVVLFGWSLGVRSAGDMAQRAVVDSGMRYLTRGAPLEARDVRAFREQQADELRALYEKIFGLCHQTGIRALGEIRLDAPGAEGDFSRYASWLVAYLLAGSQAADAGEVGARAIGLPLSAATRDGRRQTWSPGGGRTPAPTLPRRPVRAGTPPARAAGGHGQVVLSTVALLVLVTMGLGALRWLTAVTAPPKELASRTSSSPNAPFVLPESAAEVELSGPSAEELELQTAHDEAVRLALESLQGDDLVTARSFYILALAVSPDDEEAESRRRQIETALGVATRRDDWAAALTDLVELRELVSGSPTVLRAYVAALVGAGREALDRRDLRRAGDLCGEATRWFPDRVDARQCLNASGFAPTMAPAPTSAPAPVIAPSQATTLPTVLLAPTNVPAPTAVGAAPTAAPPVPAPPGAPVVLPTIPLPFPPTVAPSP